MPLIPNRTFGLLRAILSSKLAGLAISGWHLPSTTQALIASPDWDVFPTFKKPKATSAMELIAISPRQQSVAFAVLANAGRHARDERHLKVGFDTIAVAGNQSH
jgi:hypothetical protein